jgi:hypothetical protein
MFFIGYSLGWYEMSPRKRRAGAHTGTRSQTLLDFILRDWCYYCPDHFRPQYLLWRSARVAWHDTGAQGAAVQKEVAAAARPKHPAAARRGGNQ